MDLCTRCAVSHYAQLQRRRWTTRLTCLSYLFEDSKGFIWISTDMGVSRFDGYEFNTFTVFDGLPSNDVWGVVEDQKGRMWLSTFNEMTYIKDNKVMKNPSTDSLRDMKIIKAGLNLFF